MFDPFFTVRETLRIQSGYFGLRDNDAWIDELLHHLDLTDKADANMRALSGGMKRRVLVAQALVHKPPVIVLDEPTAGVDVELRQTLWQFIARLNRDGHTIVLDHALPRGGRGAVRAHRDAEGGPRGRARHARSDLLGALLRHRCCACSSTGALPAGAAPRACAAATGGASFSLRARRLRTSVEPIARRAARGRRARSTSMRAAARPTSRTCSCRSWHGSDAAMRRR